MKHPRDELPKFLTRLRDLINETVLCLCVVGEEECAEIAVRFMTELEDLAPITIIHDAETHLELGFTIVFRQP